LNAKGSNPALARIVHEIYTIPDTDFDHSLVGRPDSLFPLSHWLYPSIAVHAVAPRYRAISFCASWRLRNS
jgi:hypothetical protein